jgi:uncharacterized membrane protein
MHPPHIQLFEPQQSKLFQLSMWWRVGYGFLRLILGISLLRLIGQSVSDYIYAIMSHEFVGRTGDMILEHIYTFFEIHDITLTYFIAGYFIFWGAIDILLSLCLLHRIRQAFPITMALIVVFLIYSVYRYSFTHSLTLLGVICADIVILYLVHKEYVHVRITDRDTSTPSDPPLHQS